MRDRVEAVAAMMEEFGLAEAKLTGGDWSVEFARHTEGATLRVGVESSAIAEVHQNPARAEPPPQQPVATTGTPITSPMMGVYYSSSSPGAEPLVREGDVVSVGQVVGLIEAMKVFNEITATMAGTVTKIHVTNGQLVKPGEALMHVG